MDKRRRNFLVGGAAATALAAAGGGYWLRRQLVNPCRAALPAAVAEHPLVQAAWAGIDPQRLWDCHVHLAGVGDSGSGIEISPQMSSALHPVQYAQRLFYLNAGCAHEAPGRVDDSYVERLENLVDGMRPGTKLLLLPFDRNHDEAGRPRPELSSFYVPDRYAQRLASQHPTYFEWACSIHPYRSDCVDALHLAASAGARAVKWLPAAMGIDPASPLCDRFYLALAQTRLPLLTHAGEEQAVAGGDAQALGNPLRLRRALGHGVQVVVTHCASLGEDIDLDRGASGPRVSSFSLFARLMDDPRWSDLIHGDISAITLRNRSYDVLRQLLERQEWHRRLLYGSDYPLPGIVPLIAPAALAREGLLAEAVVPVLDEIREHNPLLFDFVLKRHLSWRGKTFAASVFDTRRHLDWKRI